MCAKFCDVRKTVSEVIEVLHNNNVCIGLMDYVLDEVKKAVEANTVPYSPKRCKISDLPISETTDNVTEPKGL